MWSLGGFAAAAGMAAVLAAPPSARGDEVERLTRVAIEQREAKDYPRAIEALRQALAARPSDQRLLLLLAETLAWNKEFGEAAQHYGDLAQLDAADREPLLGLARVRLWQGRYGEARRLFRILLERDRDDLDAAEGSATAAYWSGDYRTAQRELRNLAARDPGRESVRRGLTELRLASAGSIRFTAEERRDDQPLKRTRSELSARYFTDPLTRWDASLGAYRIDSFEKQATAPFALAENETTFPSVRLTLRTSVGGLKTPDGRSHFIGGFSLRMNLPMHSSLTAGVAQREVLTNATTLFPTVRTAGIRWTHEGQWLASLGGETLTWSDRNQGAGVDGYLLVPLFTRGGWTIRTGASTAWRNTDESRFYITSISAQRQGDIFRYSYEGAYNPYWTPHDFREGRIIAVVERRIGGSGLVKLQADSGFVRDRAVGFGPALGPLSFPAATGRAFFDREYRPRRAEISARTPLRKGFFVESSFEHSKTAWYESNSIHASVGRHY